MLVAGTEEILGAPPVAKGLSKDQTLLCSVPFKLAHCCPFHLATVLVNLGLPVGV